MLTRDGVEIPPLPKAFSLKNGYATDAPTNGAPAELGKSPAAYQIEVEDFVAAFLNTLPLPNDLHDAGPEFWNRLGVWHERILSDSMSDSTWMVSRLALLDGSLLTVLTRWLNVDVEHPTVKSQAEALCQEANAKNCIQLLFLLEALMHGRSYQAVAEMGQLVLPASIWAIIEAGGLSPRSKRLATALQIYLADPANLELMMLYERAERFSYNRFKLIQNVGSEQAVHRNRAYPLGTNFDGANHPTADAQDTNGEVTNHAGASSSQLLPSIVDKALQKFESGPQGGRHSRCLHILHQSPDTQIVFIRRVLRQTSIAEMERTLFGDEVETIVLKFHQQMSVLDERSTKGIGTIIGQTIAEMALHRPVIAIRENLQTPTAILRRLLESLRHNEDPALTFVELNLRSAPVSGSPVMMLRGSKEQPLSVAINSFEERGLFLLEELADIHQIGVVFQAEIHGRFVNHIFKIRFEHPQNQADNLSLCYMAAQASTAVCRRFEVHMRDTYEITVVPASR